MNETFPHHEAESTPTVQMNAPLHEAWSDAQSLSANPETQETLFRLWRQKKLENMDPEDQDDFVVASDIIHWSMFPHAHDRLPQGLLYCQDTIEDTWTISYASPRAKWALQNTLRDSDDMFATASGSVHVMRASAYRLSTIDFESGDRLYDAIHGRIEEMPVMRFLRSLDTDTKENDERPLNTVERLAMRSALSAEAERRFGVGTSRADNPMAARQQFRNDMLIEEARVPQSKNIPPKAPQTALRETIARIIQQRSTDGYIVDISKMNVNLGMNDEQTVAVVGKSVHRPESIAVTELPIKEIVKELMWLSDPEPRNSVVSKMFEEAIVEYLPSLIQIPEGGSARQKYEWDVDAIKSRVFWRLNARLQPDKLKDLVALNTRTILFDTMPPGEMTDNLGHANRHSRSVKALDTTSRFVSAERLVELSSTVKAQFGKRPAETTFMIPQDIEWMNTPTLHPEVIDDADLTMNASHPFIIVGYDLKGIVQDSETYVYEKSELPTMPAEEAMQLDKKSLQRYFRELGATGVVEMLKGHRTLTIANLTEALKANGVYATPPADSEHLLDPDNQGLIFDGKRFISQCSGMANYLSWILNEQGYDARPIGGYSVSGDQKTVTSQNGHAVVQVMIDGSPYYFDATPRATAATAPPMVEQAPGFRDKVRKMLGAVALKMRRTRSEPAVQPDLTEILGDPNTVFSTPAPALSEEAPEHVARPEFSASKKEQMLEENRTQCETHLAGYFGAGNATELHAKIGVAVRQGNQEAVIAQRVLQMVARSAPRFEGSSPVSTEEVRQLQTALKRLATASDLPLKYYDMSPGLLAGLQNSLAKVAASITTEV